MHRCSTIDATRPSSADFRAAADALDSHENRKWPRAVPGNARELADFKEACAAAYAPVSFKLALRTKQELFTVRELSLAAYLIFKNAEYECEVCQRARLAAVMANRRCDGDARLSRCVETSYKMDGARESWLAIAQARKQCERHRRRVRNSDDDGTRIIFQYPRRRQSVRSAPWAEN